MPLFFLNGDNNETFFIDLTNMDEKKFNYLLGKNSQVFSDKINEKYKTSTFPSIENVKIVYTKGDTLHKKSSEISIIHLPRLLKDKVTYYHYLIKLPMNGYYMINDDTENKLHFNNNIKAKKEEVFPNDYVTRLSTGKYLNLYLKEKEFTLSDLTYIIYIRNYKELYLDKIQYNIKMIPNTDYTLKDRLPFLINKGLLDVSGGSIDKAFEVSEDIN